VRICVKRKDKEGCEESRKRLYRRASRKGNSLREETVLFNAYIVVVTSLVNSVTPDEVLETYRRRRQVEIHFKRLKSIPDFGDLPKKNPAASEAWLNGKIMVALLKEAFIAKASFFPCNRIE
jgi:transposase